MIPHLLALKIAKRNSGPSTEPAEENPSSDWLRQGIYLAYSSGVDGNVSDSGHCLKTLSEQHRQLAQG